MTALGSRTGAGSRTKTVLENGANDGEVDAEDAREGEEDDRAAEDVGGPERPGPSRPERSRGRGVRREPSSRSSVRHADRQENALTMGPSRTSSAGKGRNIMATKAKSKSKKASASKSKIKSLSVRKDSADKVKGGMVPGPEDLS